MVLCGRTLYTVWNSSANVPYTSSVRMIRSGFLKTACCSLLSVPSDSACEAGLDGFTRKNALTEGSSSFSISSSGMSQLSSSLLVTFMETSP